MDELGIRMDPQLLELALIHRSYAFEHGGIPDNERLEFLGDAVLEVVVTEYLYRNYPDLPEGRLAKLRAAVVNTHALADVARSLGLGDLLRLGRGEMGTGGHDKASILADALEAVIGAMSLSPDKADVTSFVRRLFDPLIDEAVRSGSGLDYKTSLQELCASQNLGELRYCVTDVGPDHNKIFTACAVIGSETFTSASGRSKKNAEQAAARLAFEALSIRDLDA